MFWGLVDEIDSRYTALMSDSAEREATLLNTTPGLFVDACFELWRWSMNHEREARVVGLQKPPSQRGRAAQQGHITRALRAELRAWLHGQAE